MLINTPKDVQIWTKIYNVLQDYKSVIASRYIFLSQISKNYAIAPGNTVTVISKSKRELKPMQILFLIKYQTIESVKSELSEHDEN